MKREVDHSPFLVEAKTTRLIGFKKRIVGFRISRDRI